MEKKMKSPYTASLTGCGFMWEEMSRILPILMSVDSVALLKKEVVENKYLLIKTENTRKRAVTEFVKRFNAVPQYFWESYLNFSQKAKIVAMYYVILKCYKICFDLHINLILKKWNSVCQSVTKQDVLMAINEIAVNDDFVEGWSDSTKGKIATSFLSFMRKAGFFQQNSDNLTAVRLSDEEFKFYLQIGEPWFLEVCLLQPYEINRIKQSAL